MERGQLEEWICEDGGRIIATGAIIYYNFPPSYTNRGGLKGYVTNIYTDPDYRGRKIASKILEMLEKRMRERGVYRIWLEASVWGKPVYEKYGFSENCSIMTIET